MDNPTTRTTTTSKRIVWCDNKGDQANFEAFATGWRAAQPSYELEFVDLGELMDQDSSGGEDKCKSLSKESPALLLLDWEEGATARVWAELLDLNSQLNMALMSFTPRPAIEASANRAGQYPGLESSRILTRPFEPSALLALLPTGEASKASPQDTRVYLPATYGAWRWLNKDFTYVQTEPKVSQGWKLSYDRPGIQAFTEQEIRLLCEAASAIQKAASAIQEEAVSAKPDALKERSVRQYLWHELPFEPGRFDRIMLETRPLQQGDPAPAGAVYVQQAVYAPVKTSDDFERNMVQGVLKLMRGAEFARGRYYHHNRVPGLSQPVLELLFAEPQSENRRPPPAVAEMDEPEQTLLTEFVGKYPKQNSGKKTLVYKKIPGANGQSVSKNDKEVWDLYIDTSMVDEVLVVPVYFTQKEAKTRREAGHSDVSALIRGVFIFDLGRKGKIQERWITIAEPALIAALTKYTEHREKARDQYERVRLQKMDALHCKLGEADSLKEVAERTCQTALALMELGEKQAENGEAEVRADRSVLYVRYSATQQLLEQVATYSSVIQADHPLRNGDLYPLAGCRFFLVQAARDTLERLEKPFKSEDLPPLLRPNVSGLPPDEQLTAADWQRVFGDDQGRIQLAQDWYTNKVKAVLAFPVVAQGALQGVLVVRSDREYEFTQRRVDAIAKVIQAMRAHLVRVGLLQRGRAWHGLLAHELRSILGRLGQALLPSSAAKVGTSQHARTLLSLATTLAQGSLHVIHGDERQIADGHPVSLSDLQAQVNAFGSYVCAQKVQADDVDAQWLFNWPPVTEAVAVKAPDLLFRVLLMLVDNAFRHSDFTENAMQVELNVTEDGHCSVFQLRSPGQWPQAVLAYWQTSIQSLQWLDEVQDQQRPYLGLSLVHWLCAQAGATVSLANESFFSVVRIHWPHQG